MTGRTGLTLALRLTVVACLLAGLAILLRGMRLGEVVVAMERALVWPIVLAAGLNFVQMWWKAAAWGVLLAPTRRVPTRRLFRYTLASLAASAVTPARAGEMLRIWLLRRRDGVPLPTLAAVAIAEKGLDVVAMLIVVAPLPWLLPACPGWIAKTGAGLLVGAAAFVVACRWGKEWRSAPRWLGPFLGGIAVVGRPRTFLFAVSALVLGWLTDLAEVWLVLYAVGLHLPLSAGLVVLFTMNLAIAVPSTPAHVGALELGAVLALDLVGVPRASALAFALLYHAMQIVPLVAAGLVDARFVLSVRTTDAPSE